MNNVLYLGGFEMRNLVPVLLITAICFIFTACGA